VFLANKLSENLSVINGNILFGNTCAKSGILLFKNKNFSTNDLIYKLDKANICTRGGFHCSPLAHKTLGTGDDGAVRISIGFFNTLCDIEKATLAIYKICK
ncbi:MAG: aminotransferase class V-fold PLP-dependent enzyme, partial [Clostridia bacterium]|nr:aminotransferase class V-fold PLP-dependent enzyme [Clostridia bacterium]